MSNFYPYISISELIVLAPKAFKFEPQVLRSSDAGFHESKKGRIENTGALPEKSYKIRAIFGAWF